MIPARIEDVFIQVTTDTSGVILNIDAGIFLKEEFVLEASIYNTCPFLEATLEALPIKEFILIEGMVITSNSVEYNVDVELFKSTDNISVLIHDRTNIYKYVNQLNQNRNDIFFIKREISEKNKELSILRQIADKANEEKSRFLAMMSHEVRNPLNAILGYTEMILEEDINKNVRNYISHLADAGKNLKVIVEDILDLSRIEAGKLELVSKQLSIPKLVENCVKNFQHTHKNNEVKLLFSISEATPQNVLGDAVRITQILSNLISNAIKFTEKGTIKVQTEVVANSENTTIVNFKISDTGRGMSKIQVSKIFEEYEQTEINDHRILGGTGLGLSIVKRLVSAMDGKIYVDSEIGKGTCFNVEISFKKDQIHMVSKTKMNTVLEANILEGRKILVADDDVLNQMIVSHILKKQKAIVTMVSDGLVAYSKIKGETFDVILLDINMPNMTGVEVIYQQEAIAKFNKKTPFLAVTANTTNEELQRYLDIGFTDVISKPFSANEFVEKINSVF